MCHRTGWREGYISRREFHTFNNPSWDLHPLIFAEQFASCRYHSTRGFHPSAKLHWSRNTSTAILGTCSWSTPTPGGTLQKHSACRVGSSSASGIASTPTPLSGFENRPTPYLIQKPAWSLHNHCEHDLQKGIRDRRSGNGHRISCLHLDEWSPAVAASIDLVTQTWSVLYFATGRLLELYIWNRLLFMSASSLEMVSYATRHVAKA